MTARNLTDAFVKAAKCPADKALIEFRDNDVSGLELRVWTSGAKSWRLHYTRRSDGRRRVVGLGSYPSVPLKDARVRAKRMQAEIEDEKVRGDPAAARTERRLAQTFREVAEDYTELHAKPTQAANTVASAHSMLELHILPEIGAMKASAVTKRDIIRLLDVVKAKPDSRKGKRETDRKTTHQPNRVHALVRRIFRWAIGRDIVQVDPTAGISAPISNEPPRDRVLSPAEIRQLWLALDRARPERERSERGIFEPLPQGAMPLSRQIALAMKLSLATGQRIGEVSGISLADLDLNDLTPAWKIPRARAKNREPHRVPLSPLALALIGEARALVGDTPWLFPGPGGHGPMDAHAATRALGRARKAIGLPDFRVHDLRRSAATRMEEMGVRPHVIGEILNHTSVTKGTVTKRVYALYQYEAEKREALLGWARRLNSIVSGDDAVNVLPLRV